MNTLNNNYAVSLTTTSQPQEPLHKLRKLHKEVQNDQKVRLQNSTTSHSQNTKIHRRGCSGVQVELCKSVRTEQDFIPDRVLEQFYSGRALAKMLLRKVLPEYHRVERYLDELKYTDTVRSDSVSLLVPGVPLQLMRSVGFIIDADKTFIRLIAEKDIESDRINEEGEIVEWDSRIHMYSEVNERTAFMTKYNYISKPSNYFGRIKTKRKSLISSIFDLQSAQQNRTAKSIWSELIVNYGSKSIIGILMSKHEYMYGKEDTLEHKHMEVAIEFRDIAKKELGKSLPIYIIDCKTGTLDLVEPGVSR